MAGSQLKVPSKKQIVSWVLSGIVVDIGHSVQILREIFSRKTLREILKDILKSNQNSIMMLLPQGQFPLTAIFRAGLVLDKQGCSGVNIYSIQFSLVNNRISARLENSTDWKSAFTVMTLASAILWGGGYEKSSPSIKTCSGRFHSPKRTKYSLKCHYC